MKVIRPAFLKLSERAETAFEIKGKTSHPLLTSCNITEKSLSQGTNDSTLRFVLHKLHWITKKCLFARLEPDWTDPIHSVKAKYYTTAYTSLCVSVPCTVYSMDIWKTPVCLSVHHCDREVNVKMWRWLPFSPTIIATRIRMIPLECRIRLSHSDRRVRLVLIGSVASIQWFGFSIMDIHTVTSSSVESIQLTTSP